MGSGRCGATVLEASLRMHQVGGVGKLQQKQKIHPCHEDFLKMTPSGCTKKKKKKNHPPEGERKKSTPSKQ